MKKISSYEEAVEFAIEREEEAIQAYGEMSRKVKTPGLRELLLELQKEEKNHRKLLEELSRDKIDFLESVSVPDLKISDYTVDEPTGADMSLQDLLIFAAKKEQKAADFYAELAKTSKKKKLKKLFDYLVQQEKTHKLKLETEYENHVLEEG